MILVISLKGRESSWLVRREQLADDGPELSTLCLPVRRIISLKFMDSNTPRCIHGRLADMKWY